MTIEELERNLDDSQKELSALETEKKSIPGLLMRAGKSGNSEQVIQLRQRLNDLPTHIEACEISVLSAEIAVLDALAVEGSPQVAAHREAVKQAEDRVRAAQKELLSISRAAFNAEQRQKDNRQRSARLRRQIEDKSAELGKKPGAIVHSLIHAS